MQSLSAICDWKVCAREFVPAKDTFELSNVLGVMISITKTANHCAVSMVNRTTYLGRGNCEPKKALTCEQSMRTA